ncbi:dihydroorotase [Oleiphilus sp. HI0009]|uniref:dihydroorotase n=2 Tax=Oleiphilus TaxID=141450 RepID=UPI0007C3A601|nr:MULTISPECIES: dihydroorotase [unclassified Oleiphilus]KZX85534.1 dihydroorotase [Oleiphilus sp. HI0009]KZY61289.1 dihydroorotase [Oleiphilus sp. HI0066]KZY72377.1 dihydroorotase [Oleiphilus sp. HI0067]KZZ63379.1 dihydroorotase [Oleiphilus sp. HI0125]
MTTTLIKNALVVNEGKAEELDVRIKDDRIAAISSNLTASNNDKVIDAHGFWLLPGMIDDQVHFREPGLTHKGSIKTESRAAVAGGITSYMEMPNVSPATTTIEALQDKHDIAMRNSLANYSFYLGATEDNLEQIKRVDPKTTCGVKVFMGASTGSLLVEDQNALDAIFRECPVLIATHCERGPVMDRNLKRIEDLGREITIHDHPIIRDDEACYASSSYAVGLAKKFGSQLNVLHITTEKELSLFASGPVETKHITAEACVHHLWFSEEDYAQKGNLIKCNPAIKKASDRNAILRALRDDVIDIIATDHAPHTFDEKNVPYMQAPAGLPLVQHALLSLIEHVRNDRLSIEQVVQKAAHNPAIRYGVQERGFIREGYFADLVLVSPNQVTPVSHDNVLYRCEWTPFDGTTFSSRIQSTWVNGNLVFDSDQVIDTHTASALIFNRPN